jgi:hypothetical protein
MYCIVNFNTSNPNYLRMLETPIVFTKQIDRIPKIAVGILVGVLFFGMFIVGYDQGQLFSLVEGQKAFDEKWMHEFYHDLRHSAGFPCH